MSHRNKATNLSLLLLAASGGMAYAGQPATTVDNHASHPGKTSSLHQAMHHGKHAPGNICGTDDHAQDWHMLQRENRQASQNKASFANKLLSNLTEQMKNTPAAAAGDGIPGRYYIPVVFHVYGNAYNCTTGTMCLTEAKIIDGLNKTNEDFLGTNTQDGPIATEFQAIRDNLNIEFVLAKKDPNGNPTNGIVRHNSNAKGYGHDSNANAAIAADAWDNFKYMNVYIMNDLYDDGSTNNSGVAWYPQLSMSQEGLSRVVYNGDYVGTNTNENFRSVLTHEFGHWLNLPHVFDGDVCSVHQEAFCEATGDSVCDTPQMSSSILQDNTPNCLGQPTNTENFMHYSDNYAMYSAGQVSRMTAALHGAARATLWSNSNLIAAGLEDLTSNADHPWDGSGVDVAPQGEIVASFTNLSAVKGEVDNFAVDIPANTEAVAFYLDGYSEDPDLYVSKGSAPTNPGGTWNADYISFRGTGIPELVTLTSPSSTETYHAAVDAFTAYNNANLQVISVNDPTLCNGCERVFLTEENGLASAKGAAAKTYSYTIPADAVKTIAVISGGYEGDPDMYASMNSVPTAQTFDCGPFSAPRMSEYCEFGPGGGTINVMIDPFLEYSGATFSVYYERPATSGLPVAQANGPYSASVGNAITFSSGGSIDNDGSIVSYSWNFGDGSSSTAANPTHTYQAAGSYTATLTVTDNAGNTASDTAAATISGNTQAPTANANGPYSANVNQAISFSAAGSTDADGTITNYLWNFGDGQTSTQENPSHAYSAAGSFTATLTVTDNDGLTGSSTAPVSITGSVGYCTVTGNTNYEWIANVAVGSFAHASAGEGYADNTALTIPLIEGSNSISLTPGGNYTEHWMAWIDFNADGVFDDSEKVLAPVSGKGAVTGNITVPAGYVGTQARMRVVMKYNSAVTSACGTIGDGEAEDYTVQISQGTTTTTLPDACATQNPVTSGRLEDGVPACLGSQSEIWFSMGGVDAHQTVAITTGHGQGDLDILYKNGGWPSDTSFDAQSNGSSTTECIDLAAGTNYWSYLRLNGGATGATIVVDYDAPGCR